MKFYLASSFSLIDKVEHVCKILEEEGHEIVVKWWERLALKKKFQVLDPYEFYAEPECKFAFERDLEGIKESDALIFIAADRQRSYNGANVEVGIAFGLGKPVYSIGRLTNSAMYWGVQRAVCIEEILYWIACETEGVTMNWGKARKKPIVVDYRKVNVEFIDEDDSGVGIEKIHTREGVLWAYEDEDFIIKGIEGELYPIKKNIFFKTYDVVESVDCADKRIKTEMWEMDEECAMYGKQTEENKCDFIHACSISEKCTQVSASLRRDE